MKGRLYTIYCLLGFFISPLTAQVPPGQLLTNYNNEHGLPQNSAKWAKIDKDGFLWVATEMGLARFDGSRFRVFNRNNTPQLENDRIVQICLDHDHTIYFFDEKSNQYRFDSGHQLQKVDIDVALVANHSNQGYLNVQKLWNYPANKQLKEKLEPLMPCHFYFLTSGDSTTGFLFFSFMRYFTYLSGYQSKWIDSISGQSWPSAAASQGKLYYINNQQELMQVDSLGRRLKITVRNNRFRSDPTSSPKIIRVMQDGEKMYCQVGQEIWKVTSVDDQTMWIEPVMNIAEIPDWSLFLGGERLGIQVAGSLTKGLFIARKSPFQVQRPPQGITPIMYAQSPMPGSSVLTHQGVLPAGAHSLKIPPEEVFRLFLFRDNGQHYWIGKDNSLIDSLIELDEKLNVVRKIASGYDLIQCMQQSPDGTHWVSINERHLNRSRFGKIEGDSIRWKLVNGNKTYNETFIVLNNHLFLLGNQDGLQELDLEKGSVRDYAQLANASVRSLYKDSKGIVWIGTYGKGFYAMYNNRILKMPLDRSGHLSTAHTFLEDKKGYLWISTNNGLFQMKMDDLYTYLRDSSVSLYYHYYSKWDGLPTNEFNGGCNPAGIVLEDGRFSLPSMDGLVQFYPDSISPLLPVSKIFIDEVWVDSLRVADLANWKLPPSFNRMTINVSSPYFGNPYNQYIEYNLQGLDDKWYPLNENNTIIFNRLRAGKYQLQLRKKAGFGPDNYLVTRFPVTVQPGFFDSWYFYVLVALGMALLIFVCMKIRYRYLEQRKRLLEQEVETRTKEQHQLIRELTVTVQELEHSREELFYNNRFKEKLALLITHDLHSPLRFLSVMCDQLQEKVAGFQDEDVKKRSSEINNAGKEIHAFVEEFGLWATTQQEHFRIQLSSFSLGPLMEELLKFFKEMIQRQGNQLAIDIDPSVKLVTDRQLLKTILRNLIDNANKYTTNGIISVTLYIKDNKAAICVADNGTGMHPKELQKILFRIEQTSRATILDKGSRLGYQIIIDFVNVLGGSLQLHSTPETGTIVTIANLEYRQQEVESEWLNRS